MLKRRTWLKIAAPMNLLFLLTCGQTSRHEPHVMQFERGYAFPAVRPKAAGLRRDRRAVDRNPSLHAFQAFEHELPIDREIAHHREFRHRLDANRLLELIDQRGAGHGALPLISIAHEPQISSRQFESYEIGVVFLPSRVTGFSAMSRRQMITFIEGRWKSEFFPARGFLRALLALDAEDDLFFGHGQLNPLRYFAAS